MNTAIASELRGFIAFYNLTGTTPTDRARRMSAHDTHNQYREWAFSLLERALYTKHQAVQMNKERDKKWIGRDRKEYREEQQWRTIVSDSHGNVDQVIDMLFPGRVFWMMRLMLHDAGEVTPIAPRTSLAQPPVLLNPRTHEPIERGECQVCVDRPVEIRTQCPISRSGTDSIGPCHHMYCYECWKEIHKRHACAFCNTPPETHNVFMGADDTYVKQQSHRVRTRIPVRRQTKMQKMERYMAKWNRRFMAERKHRMAKGKRKKDRMGHGRRQGMRKWSILTNAKIRREKGECNPPKIGREKRECNPPNAPGTTMRTTHNTMVMGLHHHRLMWLRRRDKPRTVVDHSCKGANKRRHKV